MIIQLTSTGGAAGDTWLVKEASSQEIQSLVAFADKWFGKVDVKDTNGNYELITVSAKTSAAAEFFEQEFRKFIVKDESLSLDEPPPQDDSTGPLLDWT
ncbi:hypothetical protein [uncultured Variovorax sp.]|uniref:hypothetical protein n=1 Tax=uncultured Variovorax sp. TaxID=114708 RepID=UPI002631AD8C|nr:hypothetical protein [uncultured Variovorax sp.]